MKNNLSMFGVLKKKTLTHDQQIDFRLNYCGTCKTIGKIYGHKERLLLNYDVVFLSELLHSLNYSAEAFNSITPFSCFQLPNNLEKIPGFLKYAASVNILLGYYKLMDNVMDSSRRVNIWHYLKHFLSPKYTKAKTILEGFSLDVSAIEAKVHEQFSRERDKFTSSNFHDVIEYYSSSTGIITGQIFAVAVLNLKDDNIVEQLYRIGENLGKIVYLIDAIEDFEQDRIQNKFSIFLIDHELDRFKALEETKLVVDDNLKKLERGINSLPISSVQKKLFISRIFLNVNDKLSNYQTQKVELCDFRPSVSKRFNLALEISKRKTLNKSNAILQYIPFGLLSSILIILFILFPGAIQANNGNLEANCCGSCGGCVDSSCGGQKCCGCRELGEKEGEICGNPNMCAFGLVCVLPCLSCCSCDGGGGPKVITITKIIEVDKGCGGCK